MKKLILIALCFCCLAQGLLPALAAKNEKQVIEFKDGQYQVKEKVDSSKEIYVRINKKELDLIRRQAFISATVLQRLRDLEKLYKDIKFIIDTSVEAINFIRGFLNLDEIDFSFGGGNDFEHISGVVMSPGFVEFEVKTTNPASNFDAQEIDELEVDVYYNKKLFTIDHLEGDGIVSEAFRVVPVSSKTAGAKDRLVIPLSDLLTNQTRFRLYLAPRNPDTIKVGDKTKLDIRYYKNIPADENGERIAPINYSFAKGSATEIVVAVSAA